MPAPVNYKKVEELKGILEENENFLLSTYSGMSVTDMVDLRSEVRSKSGRVKVVKNRLFKRVLAESEKHKDALESLDGDLKGPVAVIFAGEEMPAVAKAIVEKAKTQQKIKLKAGYFDGKYISEEDVKTVANLPTREELLTIIGRGLNTPSTKIAMGMKQIMSKLARGVKAVGEKNG